MSGPGFSFVPTTSTSGGGTTYTGTTDQVIVTGTVLSTPQSINTSNCVQFLGLGIGATGCTSTLKFGNSGIIDFNSGDVTITYAANSLTFAGATGDIIFSSPVRISASQYLYAVGELDLGSNNGTSHLVLTAAATSNMKIQQGAVFGWVNSANASSGTLTATLSQATAGTVQVGKTGAAADGCVAFTNFTNLGCGQFHEMTAPQGSCNAATVYAVDNGSGKTQLMVVFQTGSPVQIAIEP